MLRVLLALAMLLAVPGAARASAPPTPCEVDDGFLCGELTVPLDRTGLVPGTLKLSYEVQKDGPAPILLDLAGGPGQSEVGFGFVAAEPLRPLLTTHRLVLFDQRGTGSTALDCPKLQRQDLPRPTTVARCAAHLGAARAFYTTVDSVLDIEDLRKALGAPSLALSGTSYGTYVAEQYASAFPARVERLLLNSPVAPGDVGAFADERFAAFPRVLKDQCANAACRHITPSPLADVAAVARRLRAGHPLAATVFDARGRGRTLRIRTETELAEILLSADLFPDLHATLPATVRAAARGDAAPLLRTLALATGGGTGLQDDAGQLSAALNVTTTCEDAQLPYSLDSPTSARPPLIQAALNALPPAGYRPFSAKPLLDLSVARECRQWPPIAPRARFTGPLPDIPALVLVGRQDLRTPVENTASLRAALPHAEIVAVAGTGHDVLDSDATGCATRALKLWAQGRPVGDPCVGRSNGRPLLPLPPSRTPRTRADVIRAARETVEDAERQLTLAHAFGVPHAGGGLRGGSWTADENETVRLHEDVYVPGVRVSGNTAGRLTVRSRFGTLHL